MSRPDLVQPRRPAQHGFRERIFQPPIRFDLLEQGDHRRFNPIRLDAVDVIAHFHGAHAAHPGIFIGEAAHQIVQQALAHGALGHPDAVYAEVLDDFQQYGQSGRKHRRALGIHVRQVELVHMAGRDHPLGEQPQVVQSDARRFGIEPAQHIADDAHRSGTAEGLQPAELAVCLLNRLEFEPHRRACALETLLGNLAVIETDGAQAHAAHRQAFQQQRAETLADHDLGRTAADIDHQTLVGAHRTRVHDPGVDQARLFQSGDDFDGMTERRAGALQEPSLALGPSQGTGADHPHAIGMHGAQSLSEALEAAQGALRGRIVETSALAETRGEAHHFPQPIQNDQLAVRMTRHDHVKAIGAQIDGGEHVGYDTAAAHLLDQHS